MTKEYPDLSAGSRVTIGEKYGPAMEITDADEAARYFKACVNHAMSFGEHATLADAEHVERSNLGYYAGYYSTETRERVERLFNCAHPIFGAIASNGAPTPAEALLTGAVMAKSGNEVAARLVQTARRQSPPGAEPRGTPATPSENADV